MASIIALIGDFPLELFLIQTLNGIVTGMILALIASGLTLIFGIMDVVNFAHGELFMLGAYLGVVVLATTGSFWLALILATLLVGLFGAAMQITTLRPLIGRDPLTTILATFGVSLILQNYALWQFGPVARKINEPLTGHFNLFYLEYPWYRLVIAGLSAAIIGGFWAFLKYGKYGIWIRATTQDRVMAQAMGIPVPWVHTAAFAIGERNRRSGAEVLRAIVLGYDICTRMLLAIGHAYLWKSGHHGTSFGRLFGATAAAGALLQLNAHQFRHALSYAAQQDRKSTRLNSSHRT